MQTLILVYLCAIIELSKDEEYVKKKVKECKFFLINIEIEKMPCELNQSVFVQKSLSRYAQEK